MRGCEDLEGMERLPVRLGIFLRSGHEDSASRPREQELKWSMELLQCGRSVQLPDMEPVVTVGTSRRMLQIYAFQAIVEWALTPSENPPTAERTR